MVKLKVAKGYSGWGGPLILEKKGKRTKVLSMTGGGIHSLARYIADYLGADVVDGFKDAAKDEELICVVINCGGTLRCGVYPQKRVPTINLNAIGPSGPLMEHIVEDIYVSGVKEENIEVISNFDKKQEIIEDQPKEEEREHKQEQKEGDTTNGNPFFNFISALGQKVGNIVSLFFNAGKTSVNMIITIVLPFMAFVSILVAFVEYTGLGEGIANILTPLGSSLWGLLIIALICGFPVLSPLLGPGAAIAQIVGTLVGTQIAAGAIPPEYALPALFAINVQVAADFFPVGLSMMDPNPETIKYGTPSFLMQKQITGPLSVIIAYFLSIGLF